MAVETRPQGLRISAPDDAVVVDLEPLQGLWTEEQYLAMTDHSRRLIEFTDGYMELLPMPTDKHQAISQVIFLALLAQVQQIGGKVHYAPLRVQIRPGKHREPDLLVVRDANDPRRQNRFWLGADLVVEIVSHDDPERDTKIKRADYAEAQIPEYWIVNPLDETVTVLTLLGAAYMEHRVFRRGEVATAHILEGFALPVDDIFDAQ